MTKQISEGRKTVYYIGMAIAGLGLLLFASTFLSFALLFANFGNVDNDSVSTAARTIGGMTIRAFGGMALIVIGGITCLIGARGLAGSGVVLDPEQAQEDLEPYSRMAGGMLKDVLDEADINIGDGAGPERVIMIRCPSCDKLNEEDSKFCQECGEEI